MISLFVRLLGLAVLSPCVLPAGSIEVELRHTAGGQALRLDSLRYSKSGGETFSVSRLSYLVSGVGLQRADGSWFDVDLDAAWIDAAKRRTTFRLEDIPSGKYRALRFHVGLDRELDRSDPASFPPGHALNPAVNNLHWSWQGGYIALALEGHYREVGGRSGFLLHFAKPGNRTAINLPAVIELDSAARVSVDFDIAALLGAPRPLVFSRDGESTHSRDGDPIAAALKANLPGAFRVRAVETPNKLAEKVERKPPLYLPDEPVPFPFKMSGVFPLPQLPLDNPLIKSRVELGAAIFADTKLSRDGSLSCASCHHADKAFTDGLPVSVGIEDRKGSRNAMPLFNLAWKEKFFWDGRAPSLREQVLMPIENHEELDESIGNVVAKFEADSSYGSLFEAAFGEAGVTAEKIALALESFLLTLTSYDSKFDRAMRGAAELDGQERRGFELFMTEYDPRSRQFGADCFHCHGGALFSDHGFHNNGLPPLAKGDEGKFSTPSLRNVALTAPYMHDGRFATLEEVVAHYNSGLHRSDNLDPNLAKHPAGGIGLPKEDQAALVAFLKSLTDPKFAKESSTTSK